jgi:hypothetical protein
MKLNAGLKGGAGISPAVLWIACASQAPAGETPALQRQFNSKCRAGFEWQWHQACGCVLVMPDPLQAEELQ